MTQIVQNSIKSLKKCYVGLDADGKHTIDKTKIDELSFLFAITQISIAIKKGVLTEEQFIDRLIAGSEPVGWCCGPIDDRENLGTVNHVSPAIIFAIVGVLAVIAIALSEMGVI